MSLFNAIFIYFLLWWITLFTVLPLGVTRNEEDGKGFDAGAPAKANLKKKLILNSGLALLLLGIIQVLIKMNVIQWHEWFQNAWK